MRILTVGDLLEKQMESMIREYMKTSKTSIGACVMPQKNDKVVFIIDEADEWVWQNAAVFSGKSLVGFYCLQFAAKVIFLTATPTKFLTKMLGLLTEGKFDLHTF